MSRHAVRLEGYNAILYQPPPKCPQTSLRSLLIPISHKHTHPKSPYPPTPFSKLIAARLAAPVSSSTSALTQRPVKVGTRHLARKTQTKQRQGHFKSEGCGGKKGGDVDEKPWMGNQINCFGLALPPHHRHCVSIFGSFAVGGTWFLGS